MRVEEPLDNHSLGLGLRHCREGVFEVIGAIDQHRHQPDAGYRCSGLHVVDEGVDKGSAEWLGSMRVTATRARFGMTSRSSWRRLPPSSASIPDRPVTFPPGSSQAVDKAGLHRGAGRRHDNRDRLGGYHGGSDRRREMRHNDIDVELTSSRSERRGAVASPPCNASRSRCSRPRRSREAADLVGKRRRTDAAAIAEINTPIRGEFARMLRRSSNAGADQGRCTRADENAPVDHVIDLCVGPASSATTSSVVFTSAKTRAMVFSSASWVSRLTSATASLTRTIR